MRNTTEPLTRQDNAGEAPVRHAGFYGKIPNRGDFIKYNLPRQFIELWDDWLQSAINISRKQLDENWLDAYLTGPIYRFILSPGLCGEDAWMGLVMPSVDRVGRHFPLTICTPLHASANPIAALSLNQPWFKTAEKLALSALSEEFSASQFERALITLDQLLIPENDMDNRTRDRAQPTPNLLTLRLPLDAKHRFDSRMPDLLDHILKETCFAYSLWSTEGSESVAPSLLVTQGLPKIAAVAALIDGQWNQWGWVDPHNDIQRPEAPQDDTEPWDR